MSSTATPTEKTIRSQFNARINNVHRKAFKAESVRGENLTIDLMAEVLIVKFLLDHPTPEERDAFWRDNRGLVEPAPEPVAAG